jgi:hypothetical protein
MNTDERVEWLYLHARLRDLNHLYDSVAYVWAWKVRGAAPDPVKCKGEIWEAKGEILSEIDQVKKRMLRLEGLEGVDVE